MTEPTERNQVANYRQIPHSLLSQEPFEGNSMSARRDHTGDYVVFSYSTEIARVDHRTGERTFNDRKYSTTTSRHQNLVRAYL